MIDDLAWELNVKNKETLFMALTESPADVIINLLSPDELWVPQKFTAGWEFYSYTGNSFKVAA